MSKSSDLPQVSAGMTSTSAGRSTFEEYQRGNLKSWNDVDKHVDRPKKSTLVPSLNISGLRGYCVEPILKIQLRVVAKPCFQCNRPFSRSDGSEVPLERCFAFFGSCHSAVKFPGSERSQQLGNTLKILNGTWALHACVACILTF